MEYSSQLGQDKFIDEYFHGMEGGIFVEAGAHDGIACSNTAFLERYRKWTGLCVEPHPEVFIELERNRTCHKLNAAIGSHTKSDVDFIKVSDGCSGCSGFPETINVPKLDFLAFTYGGKKTMSKVQVFKTQDALDMFGIKRIDFFSLDTEGGELEAIKGIDFTKTTVRVFCIEDNDTTGELCDILDRNGYEPFHSISWDTFWRQKGQ